VGVQVVLAFPHLEQHDPSRIQRVGAEDVLEATALRARPAHELGTFRDVLIPQPRLYLKSPSDNDHALSVDRREDRGARARRIRTFDVYPMRMARVNVTIPDDLYARARQARLNVSQLTQRAVAAELTRRAKLAELDTYLAELEAELGPISDGDRADAKAWADTVIGPTTKRRSA
jgi:post-segregation antitoxin (ccd killing protein)